MVKIHNETLSGIVKLCIQLKRKAYEQGRKDEAARIKAIEKLGHSENKMLELKKHVQRDGRWVRIPIDVWRNVVA